ncbi:lipase [Streptomyces aureoverticillatus]|nr:lipase [Streptomyces aureoverticillatus]
MSARGKPGRPRPSRLPEAAGAHTGATEPPWGFGGPPQQGDGGPQRGDGGPPLRLAVIGDSLAAGVGADTHGEALAGQLARALTGLTGRAVSWRVTARKGATLAVVRRGLLPGLTDPPTRWRPDLVLVAAGSNDALPLRRPRAFRAEADRLVRDIRLRLGEDVPVVFAGLPPMTRVGALPRWARRPLNGYVRSLDRGLARLPRRHAAVFHLPSEGPPRLAGEWFAADRLHPSPQGYRAWARELAAGLATLLESVAYVSGRGLRSPACGAGAGPAASPWRP